MPNVLSIQSSVAYGHVGNSAAVFPLQRLGLEVWAVHTVQFSNHTGYGAWRGEIKTPEHIADVVRGIEERGVLAHCDGVVSGYLGGAALGEVVLDTVAKVKALNPNAIYACDPVIGDVDRGVFVRPGIPEFFKDQALARADLVTPNQFELAYLAGLEVTDLDTALAAAEALRALGPRTVFVTSLEAGVPDDRLGVLAVGDEGAWLVTHPRLEVRLNGTGDVITALLTAERLQGSALAGGLARAVSRMFALVEATQAAGARELQLVQAQDTWLHPARMFEPTKLG
ncbi:MAG: pyridoxal kinase PdxY [Geminicoccaceae bacterium]|nr:MAG: pyridoxal kinase PdxY [Geminicoccaceae bacterium]